MDPIRILHLSTERTWRGGEQQIAYLIESSREKGIEVTVAARPGSAFEQWCNDQHVPAFPVAFANGLDLGSALAIKRICRKINASLVHIHSGKGLSIAYLSVLMGMKVPLVVHRRVDFPIKESGFSLAKYNHNSVKRIICVSQAIADMVKRSVRFSARVKTVYSGIDFARFNEVSKSYYLHDELGLDHSIHLVANVSAVAPHKDYHTFINVAAKVLSERRDVCFLIVGDGELLQEMKARVKNLRIEDNVIFTGFRDDIPLLLREIDIFLLTSETEGLGTTIIDAMYNAIPVVATSAGGIPELVENEKTGFLSEIRDVGGLAESVNKLLDNNTLAKNMGELARIKSLHFSKEKMASRVIEIYKELLGEDPNNHFHPKKRGTR